MTTTRFFSILPLLLISLAPFPTAAAEGTEGKAAQGPAAFADPLARRTAFPIPPGSVPDYGYARLARYVVAFMYGLDERNQQVDAWYIEERLETVKGFYSESFGHVFSCETVDHREFIYQHWNLFKESSFADPDGAYEHCASGRLDLFSPVYNYALQTWQTGTMIVFRR